MRRLKPKYTNLVVLLVIIALVAFSLYSCLRAEPVETSEVYAASIEEMVTLYNDKELTETTTMVPRGTLIELLKTYSIDEVEYAKVKFNNTEFYLNKDYIVEEESQVLKTNVVYIKSFTNLYQNNFEIVKFLEKGTALSIVDFELSESGEVVKYFVEIEEISGYVVPFYTTLKEDEIEKQLVLEQVDEKYRDFNPTPRVKPNFASNPYRDDIRAVYLSYHTLTKGSFDIEKEVERYVKNGPINAIVFDIKHDIGNVSFISDTVAEFGTGADKNGLTKEEMTELINYCKENDVYLIARIVTFRDDFFADKYPETAYRMKDTGEVYKYADSAFISAFDRTIWEYNLGIAEEVADLGFNEIQFDYVRFSEHLSSSKHTLSQPIANESKTQAIQRYLEYAKDRLTRKEVYVAADLYGLVSYHDVDASRLGQFFEAMSTTVDIICPMAYPSHYSSYFSKSEPSFRMHSRARTYDEYYGLIKYYTQDLNLRNKLLEHPAKLRMWIEGYSESYIPIMTADKMPAQVSALKENGVYSYLYWGNGREYNDEAMADAHSR